MMRWLMIAVLLMIPLHSPLSGVLWQRVRPPKMKWPNVCVLSMLYVSEQRVGTWYRCVLVCCPMGCYKNN